ncbi:S1 family peptidase [Tenacibaculum amylolyticum]|uniref:S1 family peptidase n=1 Tax=Tenacibaculum amylolyticum TaxID=104269 RepID=UPI0038943352
MRLNKLIILIISLHSPLLNGQVKKKSFVSRAPAAIIESINENENYTFINICGNRVERLKGVSKYDSRLEIIALDSLVKWQSSIIKTSKSVAIIIEKERLHAISNSEYQLDFYNTLQKTYNLCANEAFTNQPVVGSGTAFVISEQTMITAKHVFERPIKDYVIVFGFQFLDKKKKVSSIILASNIFYPTSIEKEFDELDVVQFKVDRVFPKSIPVLEWENSKALQKRDEIYMIGHPTGLPKKAALNADIINNSKLQYFYTSLDSFQGNSGSPVFNLCSNKVIGILVSGQLDYEFNGSCYKTTLCKYPQCLGEKVIRIENVMRN